MARVSISKAYHRMYQEMTRKEDGRVQFQTMKDFFMFNFVIGARNGVRVKVESGVDIFASDIFSADDMVALHSVYMAESRDLSALESGLRSSGIPAEVLACAEEYANAGAAIVTEHRTPQDQEKSFALLLLDGEGLSDH